MPGLRKSRSCSTGLSGSQHWAPSERYDLHNLNCHQVFTRNQKFILICSCPIDRVIVFYQNLISLRLFIVFKSFSVLYCRLLHYSCGNNYDYITIMMSNCGLFFKPSRGYGASQTYEWSYISYDIINNCELWNVCMFCKEKRYNRYSEQA